MSTISTKKVVQTDNNSLLKLGIHLGHKKSRWHPSMLPFVFEKRNNIYLMDIEKTQEKLAEAVEFIRDLYANKDEMVFIGTKPNVRAFLHKFATENKLLHITERWIGGILTNFTTIKKRIARLQELEAKQKSQEFEAISKKDKRVIVKEAERLHRVWGGLGILEKMPKALFLLDVPNSYLAIGEAKKQGIKVVAICDTDADIRDIDYPIPANDDSLMAIEYILGKVGEAIKSGRGRTASPVEKSE
ncbi:MAG: 30S ribosomal protein S2 [Candidatus Paceibacterota bacterium]